MFDLVYISMYLTILQLIISFEFKSMMVLSCYACAAGIHNM